MPTRDLFQLSELKKIKNEVIKKHSILYKWKEKGSWGNYSYIIKKNFKQRLCNKEDISVHIYVPNIRTSKYIKQILPEPKLKNRHTKIIRNFNTPLTSLHRLCKEKVDKKNLYINYIVCKMELTDIYRISYSKL